MMAAVGALDGRVAVVTGGNGGIPTNTFHTGDTIVVDGGYTIQ
jgi:hypothetical protein